MVGDTQFTYSRIQGLEQFFFGFPATVTIHVEYRLGLLIKLPFPAVCLIGMNVVLLR
jgi:hypothetical protein